MTRTSHTGHDHPATPAARAICRKAAADRRAVVQARMNHLLAEDAKVAHYNFLIRAAVRLGASRDNLDVVVAAEYLATWRADMGGGRWSDGVTWSEVLWMFS